jgi:hypothetical protein
MLHPAGIVPAFFAGLSHKKQTLLIFGMNLYVEAKLPHTNSSSQLSNAKKQIKKKEIKLTSLDSCPNRRVDKPMPASSRKNQGCASPLARFIQVV